MSREWKPGDVAIRTSTDGEESMAMCVAGSCHSGGAIHWHTIRPNSKADWDSLAYEGVSYRPLVVIDPESDADLSRLWRSLPTHLVSIDQLQTALREFANPTPPKPEEPTGLGAVVEDADGKHYVRTVWRSPWVDCRGHGYDYAEFDAVRVLSEGVTP